MIVYVVWTVGGAIALWHIYGAAVVSWHVAKSQYFSRWQKATQYLIAWVVPLVGVGFILHMLGPEAQKRQPGWFPLIEPLILASFGVSAANEVDSMGSAESASEPSTVSEVDAND